MRSRKGRLGIMVTRSSQIPPFGNQHFYRALCAIGQKQGLLVFVFSPEQIDWSSGTVSGYSVDAPAHRWSRRRYPLPDLIYDRCFFRTKAGYMAYRSHVSKLRRLRTVTFLGHGLHGKRQVYDILSGDSDLARYLPETRTFGSLPALERWLGERGQLFMKPQGGSQGRNVLHIRAAPLDLHPYIVKGRNAANRLFRCRFASLPHLYRWLKGRTAGRRYIMQPYLELTTVGGEPFDIRSFVQKNKSGHWQLIGMAMRRGKPGGLTSNLHGGGHAEQVRPFLQEHYGEKAADIMENMQALSMRIAETLEREHGRLVELGIDLGIDKSGGLWILEANSKPGRTIFLHTKDKPARRLAISNPIHYACYLWGRRPGGLS